jgi:hypothetical protein
MTPKELYNLASEREYLLDEPYGILIGTYYNHVPELDVLNVYSPGMFDPSSLVTIKELKHFNFDYRRYWRLATVWVDQSPVMVIQNAGREGDDWAKRYVTDEINYRIMVRHLFSLYNQPIEQALVEITDSSQDLGRSLTEFYGNNLHGYFERF